MTKGNRPIDQRRSELSRLGCFAHQRDLLRACFQRLIPRRGKKRAIGASGRSILVSVWTRLTWRQLYQDLGGDYYRMNDAIQAFFRLVRCVSYAPAAPACQVCLRNPV